MSDEAAWMEAALAEARGAVEFGEVPVGAVVVLEGEIVGRGHNRTLLDCDPSAHAEIVALREAAKAVGNHRLTGAILACTLEPCLMCCGALVHARVGRLLWAADDPKKGATAPLAELQEAGRTNHRVILDRGPGASEASTLLKAFFRARRG